MGVFLAGDLARNTVASISKEEMDELLDISVLRALAFKLKDADLPTRGSQFCFHMPGTLHFCCGGVFGGVLGSLSFFLGPTLLLSPSSTCLRAAPWASSSR